MKKLLKSGILFITAMLLVITTANAQDAKTKKVMVNKEVEIIDGKEMVTLTITKEEDGKVTVIDTTFESTGEENVNAILMSYGVNLPGESDEAEGENIMIKKIVIDSTDKDMIFKPIDLHIEIIDGKRYIRTIKDGDTIMSEILPTPGRLILDNRDVIEDSVTLMNKEVIVVIRVNITDLTDDEWSKLKNDKVFTKKAQPMDEVQVNAYPNPTNGSLNISFTLKTEGDTDVKLVNSAGETIYTESLDDFKGNYAKDIDLADNAKGVYYLVVVQGKEVLTKKIVLQ